MVSKQERMRQKCSQYLEIDLRENLQFSQLLVEKPFLGVLVTRDDQVFGLGADTNGFFGLGPVTEIPQLTKIDSLCGKKIRQFAASETHILALSQSGAVYAWGYNKYGQLGNNSKVNSSVPIIVAGDLRDKKVIQIECSDGFSAAVTEDGKLFTWGLNEFGRTGHGARSGVTQSPRVVEGLLSDEVIVKISCNNLSLLCLSSKGKVFGFGSNYGGNLGINSTGYQSCPVVVKIPDGLIVQDLTSGHAHTLAVTDQGVLFAWGANDFGELGTGDTNRGILPARIELDNQAADSVTVNGIFAEDRTSFAMDDNGDVYVWGSVNGESVMRPTNKNIAFPVTSEQTTSSDQGSDSIGMDLLSSFDEDDLSDFVITVEGKDIYVHKTILQIRSPYFRTMFSNDWQETGSGKAVIQHYSYDVYYEFLRYLYCGTLRDLDPEKTMRLMDLATMALDNKLAKLCEKRIKKQLTVENLLKVYSAALLLEKEDLVDYCVKRFNLTQMDEIIGSAAFDEIPAEHLRDFFRKFMLTGAFKAK